MAAPDKETCYAFPKYNNSELPGNKVIFVKMIHFLD